MVSAAPNTASQLLCRGSPRVSWIPACAGMTSRSNGGHDLLVASDPDDFAAESSSMASPLRKIIGGTRDSVPLHGQPLGRCQDRRVPARLV